MYCFFFRPALCHALVLLFLELYVTILLAILLSTFCKEKPMGCFDCNYFLTFACSGGDRARLLHEADMSNVYAVIAPNMGKQIVAFQVGLALV